MYPENKIPSRHPNGNGLGGFAKLYKTTELISGYINLALLESFSVPCFMCCLNVPNIYLMYYLATYQRHVYKI